MRRLTVILVLALALALLSGCRSPQTKYSDTIAQLAPPDVTTATLYGATDRWWETFNDPTLNTLISTALSNNLDIAQAAERLTQAHMLERESTSVPRMSTGISKSGDVEGRGKSRYQGSLSASYELDYLRKSASRVTAATYDASASRFALNALYMSISAETAERYFQAIEQQERLRLQGLTAKAYEALRISIERRYALGGATAFEVLSARQQLASSGSAVPSLESAYYAATEELALLSAADSLPDLRNASLPAAPEFPTEIPSDLLTRRPDVQAALAALSAQNERVALAMSERFPSFNLAGSLSGSSTKLAEIVQSKNLLWALSLDIALPIFEAGKRKAAVGRSEAALREKLAAYHKAVLSAMKEVRVALMRNDNDARSIALLTQELDALTRTLEVATRQYLQGQVDYTRVLDTRRQLYAIESSLVSARRQLLSDRIQLARALGGHWMAAVPKPAAYESERVTSLEHSGIEAAPLSSARESQ